MALDDGSIGAGGLNICLHVPIGMSVNQIQVSKEVAVTSHGSVAGSVTSEAHTAIVDTNPVSEQQEMQTLRQIIVSWRELESEATAMAQQVREKKKRQKALEEMILRIMKKHNIGALDLKGSGGRLLYRRQTSKGALNPKVLTGLLATHLKSETAAADAIKYINENRVSTVRESLLYEKN